MSAPSPTPSTVSTFSSSSSIESLSLSNTNEYLTNMFSLEGKSCIVTGGGTDIGSSLAEVLAQAGCTVVIVGRRQHILDKAALIINTKLGYTKVYAIACDITQFDMIPSLIQQATTITGGIAPTILINNAGVNVRTTLTDLTPEHFQISYNLMITAPFILAQNMISNMKDANYGRIISIASLQSYQAFPNSIPYSCCKSGMLGLTRSLAEAFSPVYGYNGITVNAIAPGFLKTALTESVFADPERVQKLANCTMIGRNSIPSDLIGTCLFLCSPIASSYITGQTIPVDGGFVSLGLR